MAVGVVERLGEKEGVPDWQGDAVSVGLWQEVELGDTVRERQALGLAAQLWLCEGVAVSVEERVPLPDCPEALTSGEGEAVAER